MGNRLTTQVYAKISNVGTLELPVCDEHHDAYTAEGVTIVTDNVALVIGNSSFSDDKEMDASSVPFRIADMVRKV